jgi:hypothetical protein
LPRDARIWSDGWALMANNEEKTKGALVHYEDPNVGEVKFAKE